jgi:CBS domain-containing protein
VRSVKIADYMASWLVTFNPGDSVIHAMRTLLDNRISGAPVVDNDNRLVGVLSETDLLEVVMQDSYYDQSAGIVADFMKAPVETVEADSDIYSLAERFRKSHRRRFPVLQNGELVGQISRRDVLRAAIDMVEHRSKG